MRGCGNDGCGCGRGVGVCVTERGMGRGGYETGDPGGVRALLADESDADRLRAQQTRTELFDTSLLTNEALCLWPASFQLQ